MHGDIRPSLSTTQRVMASISLSESFLPAVWEELPRPRDFLNHLKRKAGLPMDYWSDSMQVSRYQVEDIEPQPI